MATGSPKFLLKRGQHDLFLVALQNEPTQHLSFSEMEQFAHIEQKTQYPTPPGIGYVFVVRERSPTGGG
jgi:hypothetical protein